MPNSRPEITALTGLRAVAAFWVVLFHLQGDLEALHPLAGAIARILAPAGYLGVDLFFILSGFIISYNYRERFRSFYGRTYLRFLWTRLARIYPVHLFTLCVLVAFVLYRENIDAPLPGVHRFGWDRLLENLALIDAWALPIVKSWNVPSWSISAEWLAYLLFPVISAAALAVRGRAAAVLVSALLFGGAVAAYATLGFKGTVPYGLLRIGAEFSVGCLLYGLYRQNCFRSLPWGLVFASVYVLATVGGAALLGYNLEPMIWAPVLLAMLVYGLSGDEGALCRFLSRPGVMYWGTVSYSLYMVHFVVLLIFHSTLPIAELAALPWPARLAYVVGLLATILLAAVFTYHFVEQPCRRWMKRRMPLRAPRMASA